MEKHRLNKYWLIGPGVIAIILLVLALVHDFMPEIRLLMDLTPAHRAELLTMIRSNGIRDLIFMLLLVGVMNAIPGLSNAVIYVFSVSVMARGSVSWLTGRGIFWAIVPSPPCYRTSNSPIILSKTRFWTA
ncbi:hypothetical protein [Limosilactobacillus fermentum]|uniref:hypothetical protein n=1 Tax=Limosilactobacillus fermentum TaxID=1613 RepID=UPI001EE821E9|nr:hypothetical protein [Limosilactobacillus fermentum]